MSAPPPAKLNLKLRELNQLFNSMDPSPFLDRDLDDDAEEFIVSSARELDGSHAYELTLHLGSIPDPERAAGTEHAVQHYFAARAELKHREFRLLSVGARSKSISTTGGRCARNGADYNAWRTCACA